jgi:hypothetical protein
VGVNCYINSGVMVAYDLLTIIRQRAHHAV